MDAPNPPENTPQSFVIRLWLASPRQWHGTIHHVQSGIKLGFTKLEQALTFITQHTSAITRHTAPTRTTMHIPYSRVSRRQVGLAWAMLGISSIALIALLLANPDVYLPLSGAAFGIKISWDVPIAFIGGIILGGAAVWLWLRN